MRRQIHIIFEILALVILAPYLLYLSTIVEQPHSCILVVIALGTFIVDGYLLYRFSQNNF